MIAVVEQVKENNDDNKRDIKYFAIISTFSNHRTQLLLHYYILQNKNRICPRFSINVFGNFSIMR